MNLRSLIEKVEKKINIQGYYEGILKKVKRTGDKSAQHSSLCPLHEDKTRSFSVNYNSGLWVCHACDPKGGNIFQFVQKREGLDFKGAVLYFADRLGIDSTVGEKIIGEDIVKKYVETLWKSEESIEYLKTKRGLTPDTIKKFQLGFHGNRIAIPIRNDLGQCVNIRLYKRDAKKDTEKMISWKTGYGTVRIFPIKNVLQDEILWTEGEWDTMLACQLGYNAITATGSAGTFKSEWLKHFKKKAIWLVLDVDPAGRTGAERVAGFIAPEAREVKNILLPLTEPKNADLTNYILDNGYTKKDLDKLILQTEMFVAKKKSDKVEDPNVYEIHLSQASLKDYYYKNIQLNVLVAGKNLAPFIFPKKCAVSCSRMGAKKCDFCDIAAKGGEVDLEFSDKTNEILQLVGCTDAQQRAVIKKKAGVYMKCDDCDIITKEAANIEELRVIPELDFSAESTEYVIRNLFYIGHGLRLNQTYTFQGLTLPDPKNQYATHLINKATPFQDDVQGFEIDEELNKDLKVFQPRKGQSIKEKFDEIHEDLSFNVTRIYERNDLITAIDLVYHSVAGLNFMGKPVSKAWTECLILGDTRTGKSETIANLIQHYKAGESITGENTTFAGLIGGIQEVSGRFSLVWGKIPLNDRRLVVIDECSALSLDSIERMSGIRSSGIAEIVKIQTERTNARTRLIWISNPRSPRSLSEYNSGVTAIKELIGRPEDIARFDFALTVASGEVKLDVINAIKHKDVPHRFTSHLSNRLIMWAWSRKREDIIIDSDTVQAVLDVADLMGKKYSSAIPLVEAAEQRIKIIRLATAVACRMFSTDETGVKVIVTPDHVEFIYLYLAEIYAKPSLAYDLFSEYDIRRRQMPDEAVVKDELERIGEAKSIAEGFLSFDAGMSKSDIEDITSLESKEAKKFLSFLVRRKALQRRGSWFFKSPAFILMLRQMQK